MLLAEHMKKKLLWRSNRRLSLRGAETRRGAGDNDDKAGRRDRDKKRGRGRRNVLPNMKVNMLIDQLPEVRILPFSHMGDGGLSLGAAYHVDFAENGALPKRRIDHVYYGPS